MVIFFPPLYFSFPSSTVPLSASSSLFIRPFATNIKLDACCIHNQAEGKGIVLPILG